MDVCGDGSVTKHVQREGQGPVPVRGDKIRVHYRGRVVDGDDSVVDGVEAQSASVQSAKGTEPWVSDALTTYFDDSFSRGSPLTLTLGFDPVISGWTDVLGTMSAGERAIVTIKPEKGYGPMGRPPSIPPNATLMFDMEVLEIQRGKVLNGDRGASSKSGESSEEASGVRDQGGGGPIHTKASPKRAKAAELKDVNGSDGVVKRYIPAGFLKGRAASSQDTADDLSQVACEVLLYQQLPKQHRRGSNDGTASGATASAATFSSAEDSDEAAAAAAAKAKALEEEEGEGKTKTTKTTTLETVATKLVAVRAVASFVVDSSEDGHWEGMDWCVKDLGVGETGDFVIGQPFAMKLFDDDASSSSSSSSSSPLSNSQVCASVATLFRVAEPMDPLEDPAAAEAAVRALALSKKLQSQQQQQQQQQDGDGEKMKKEEEEEEEGGRPSVTAATASSGGGGGGKKDDLKTPGARNAEGASSSFSSSSSSPSACPSVFMRLKVVAVDKTDGGRWHPLAQDLSVAQKLVRAGLLRELGNQLFKQGDFARAGRRYGAALNLISLDQGYSVAERRAVRAEGLLCFLNRAQCSLKRGQWKNAKRDAQCAVGIDPENVKALFRRGLALVGLEDWDAAKVDLEKVLLKEPKNASAVRALKRVKAECRELELEQRKVFRGAFKESKGNAASGAEGGAQEGEGGEGSAPKSGEKGEAAPPTAAGEAAGDRTGEGSLNETASSSSSSTSSSSSSSENAKASENAAPKATAPKKKKTTTTTKTTSAKRGGGLLLYDDKPAPKPRKNKKKDDEDKEEEFEEFDVPIPAGVKEGDRFPFVLPRSATAASNTPQEPSVWSSLFGAAHELRAEVEVTVPPKAKPGDTFKIRVPKDQLNKASNSDSTAADDDDEPLSGPVGGGLVRPTTRTWAWVLFGASSLLTASGKAFHARRNFNEGTNGGGSGDVVVIAYVGLMLLIVGCAGLADEKYSKSQMCEMWCSMAFAMCIPSAALSAVWVLTFTLKAPALVLIAKSTYGGLWPNLVPSFGPFGNAPNAVLAAVTIPLAVHLWPFMTTLRKVFGDKVATVSNAVTAFVSGQRKDDDNNSDTEDDMSGDSDTDKRY